MNMQEAIKDYNAKGFNLIPLARNSKIPMAGLELEKYFTEKYPVGELLALAENYDINLGMITGKTSNLAVVDVDTNDKNIHAKYLSQYPTDMVARTPNRDGRHLFYQYKDGLPEILKIENGDFYAGHHYVVLAPSKIDGKQYEWLKNGKPGLLPETLFTSTMQMQTGKYTRQQVYDLINTGMTTGLVDGQWNDTILYGSMILAGDGMTEDAIFMLMQGMNKGARPIPERQVRGMIRRGIEYAQKDTYQKDLPPQQQAKQDIQFNVSSYASVQARYEGYEASWIVDGWMLDSAVMILAAPPERYKTWLSVDLALSVASGLPFLDMFPVNKIGNVLIIQQEDFGARYFARFKAVERAKLARARLPVLLEQDGNDTIYKPANYDISNRIFFHEDAELSLENDASIDKLEQRIKETNAVLVVIDPFYSLGSTDDHFAGIAQKLRERVKPIRNHTGCAFLFIHHSRKSGSAESFDTLSRANIFGSTFVSAAMEGTWVAGRTKGLSNTQIDLERRFKDEFTQPLARINFVIDMKNPDDEKAYRVDVQEIIEELLDDVKAFIREDGAQTATAIYNKFSDKFTSRSSFTRWLKSQMENGLVQDGTRGKISLEPDTD